MNLLPGKDGLLHISQIAHQRVEKVTDFLKEGQIVTVKVLETDEKGRVKLSMKALLDRDQQPPPASTRQPACRTQATRDERRRESDRDHGTRQARRCCGATERPDAGRRRRRGC